MKETQNFLVRSDGTFQAYMGDVVLKAQKVGETEGYHFTAVASTPDKDREGEVLLQKGLNFEPFIEHGEFNWNHLPHAIVGVPVGKKAWFENDQWMAEGIILKSLPIWEGYSTDMVVQQHNQLKKSGFSRGLCCSVEGKVTERSDDGKYVKKADIYNIALTFRPVNPSCTVAMLAKSLHHHATVSPDDNFYKSLAAQSAAPFVREDLEGSAKNSLSIEDKLVSHLVSKGHKRADAEKHVYSFMKKKFSGKKS